MSAGGKGFAVGEYVHGRLEGFHMRSYDEGHAPTNYALWVASDLPYTVEYVKVSTHV